MQIDQKYLDHANADYEATLNERNRVIRDPIITPFGWAMKLAGYSPVLVVGGCTKLRSCPNCKSSYSTQYKKDGLVFWGCPHCKQISEE